MNLFSQNYKPRKITSAFNDQYIKCEGEGGEEQSIKLYPEEIAPYLGDMIDDNRTSGECKPQLSMKMKFMSTTKDDGEGQLMHFRSDTIEIMTGVCTDEIIEKFFNSLFHSYQGGLEKSIKGISFVYDGVKGLYYKCHTISLNCGGSYIDSPQWLKKPQKIQKIMMLFVLSMRSRLY